MTTGVIELKIKVPTFIFIAATRNELRVRVPNVSASPSHVFGSHIGPNADCRV
jgi:hypothetical protein